MESTAAAYELGAGQWFIWIVGVLVFGALILLVARAAFRAGRRPPEQFSAAARLAREQQLDPQLQADLAALAQRREDGQLSDADYETARAERLGQPR